MRNVVVTGGSRGLGIAIAGSLAHAGCCVIAIARRASEPLAAAIAQADAERRGALHFRPFDLANKHKSGAAIWMGGAFFAALAVAAAALVAPGTERQGVLAAVTATARLAFAFFWLSYAGKAIATLFGPRGEGLATRGRAFGLAFAAALSVHLALVGWLFRISLRQPLGGAGIVYFGIGALWTYALVLGSTEKVRRTLHPLTWRIASGVGVEYIYLLFFLDFVVHPIRNGFGHPLEYAPFSFLVIAGPVLRWTAMIRRWRARHCAT